MAEAVRWGKRGARVNTIGPGIIAAVAAIGDDEELDVYLRRGLESGLTGAQIGEAVTHVAFYAGWSKATKAMKAVRRVLGR